MQLTESVPTRCELTSHEAELLIDLGRRLRGPSARAGTVIDVRPADAGGARTVTVRDAVGVLALGARNVQVDPKIPLAHAIGLLNWSLPVARTTNERARVATGEALWELLTRWFVDAAAAVIRRGLLNDYQPERSTLGVVRGRVEPLATMTALARGRVAISCEFDAFDTDHALNRLVLAALRRVAASPATTDATRVAARRAALSFERVSTPVPGDMLASPDARSHYYGDAVGFAKLILRGTAINPTVGQQPAWAFLVRTPESVEEGLRKMLNAALLPAHSVTKSQLRLAPSGRTLNPDLVFDGGAAVGDVKYRLATTAEEWRREDLYQVVAFAAGFRARRALLLTFSSERPLVRQLSVGEIEVTEVQWDARAVTTYADAAARCVRDVRAWLDDPVRRRP